MRIAPSLLATIMLIVAGCAAQQQPTVSSTEGTTLVEIGQVTNVRDLSEISVRFNDGNVRTYQVKPEESFRVGDPVKVITNRGNTRLSH